VYAVRLARTFPRLPILLASAYGTALYVLGTVSGNAILDVLFADRFAFEQVWSRWSGKAWLAGHGLVMLGGWVVVFVGMVCLVGA